LEKAVSAMTQSRTDFLERVRQAIRAGRAAGLPEQPPARGAVGYEGAGQNPSVAFRDALVAAGGRFHAVSDRAHAATAVCELVGHLAARKVLIGRGPLIGSLGLAPRLSSVGIETIPPETGFGGFFAADASVTGVDCLVAETGTLVIRTSMDEPRSLSLIPPVHIAVAEENQIIPDLFDLFPPDAPRPPSCLTLITGPSKTGDIELRLVTGVHGPGQVHLVLITVRPV
jgi:L-lactate utilization protein LutC